MPSKEELKMLQSLPLEVKIKKSQQRIKEWVEHYGQDGVYISFSGGKDSTVLLDIARNIYPEIEAVFVNTGLEYSGIVNFVKRFKNVTILYPSENFKEVLTKYGYPVVSKDVAQTIYKARINLKNGLTDSYRLRKLKGTLVDKNGKLSAYNMPRWAFLMEAPFRISHYCCIKNKESPIVKYERETQKKPMLGMLAEESLDRKKNWFKTGCNAFDTKRPKSNPLSFWTENDILAYIHIKKIKVAPPYGKVKIYYPNEIDGQININDYLNDYRQCEYCTTECVRTGCIYCLFGAHLEKDKGRMELLKEHDYKRYKYVMGGGEFDSEGMWIPSNKGLGFKFIIDRLNENGSLNIKY